MHSIKLTIRCKRKIELQRLDLGREIYFKIMSLMEIRIMALIILLMIFFKFWKSIEKYVKKKENLMKHRLLEKD